MAAKEEYKAYVAIGTHELEKFALVSPSDLVSEVAAKIKNANNLRAEIVLYKDGMALDISKSLQSHENIRPLLGPDKTYRFGGILVLDKSITAINAPEKLSALQSQVETLSNKCAMLTKQVTSLMELIKEQNAEIRRRPKGWVKILYPGSLVWIRPDKDPMLSPDILQSIHENWKAQINANTNMYSVAVNGPLRNYTVDYLAHDGQVQRLEIWCVRIIIPAVACNFGQVQEFDAIGGWKRVVHDTFTDMDMTQTVYLLSDIYTTPNDAEFYLGPVTGTIVPSTENEAKIQVL